MNKRIKGIVLVTIMLLLSVIIMIAGLLIVSGKNALILGANFSEREQALYAAECGIAYTQYCISRFLNFNGNEATLSYMYDPGFTDFKAEIIPSSGKGRCIHGTFNGGKSEFYVAFYDGSWDAYDIRKDKNGKNLDYYSVNNLTNTGSYVNSICYDGASFRQFRQVPPQRAHIISEGRCNRSVRYAEAVLKRSTKSIGTAFSVTAGGMDINLMDNDSVFLVNSATGSESKIRSLGDIVINSGSSTDKNCFLISNNGVSCTGKGSKTEPEKKYTYINGNKVDDKTKQQEFGISCDNSSQTNYMTNSRLTWRDVAGNYISENNYNENVKCGIKSGTYIYKNSAESPSTYKLFYYPEKYNPEESANFVSNVTGYEYSKWINEPLVNGSDIVIKDNVNMQTLLKNKDYLFKASDATGIVSDIYGNTDFALAVYDYDADRKCYLPSTNYRASFRIEGKTGKDPCLITKSGGNIYIGGELSGSGKVLGGGDISFQGKSMIESDKSNGVSLYSQGSVTVNPVVGTGGGNDPNDALKAAWGQYTSGLGDATDGYYTSKTDNYGKLKEDLLNTRVGGKLGSKTYSSEDPPKLIEVLTDNSNYDYENGTVNEMVSTLVSKNTYIGEDYTPPHQEEKKFGNWEYTYINNVGYQVYPYNKWDYDYEKGKYIYTELGKRVCLWTYDDKNNTYYGDYYLFDTANDNVYLWSYKYDYKTYKYETSESTPYLGSVLDRTNSNIKDGKICLSVKDSPVQMNLQNNKWDISYMVSGSSKKSDKIKLLDAENEKFSGIISNDTLLKGLIYTWGDLYGPNLQGGSFTIRGAVIAYGGNPENENPGDNGKGKIILKNGKNITFTYDQDYLHLLLDINQGNPTERIFHAFF